MPRLFIRRSECSEEAAPAGCKAADVTSEPFDKNKPGHPEGMKVPLIVCVKFRGEVAAVNAAIEAAKEAAENVSGVVCTHVIPNPTDDTDKMLKLNAFDKR